MANTFGLISSQTLSGTTTSVTFSSIPQTYTDLLVKVSARSVGSGGTKNLLLQLNSTTSGYSTTWFRTIDTTLSSDERTGDSSWLIGYIPGSDGSSVAFSANEYYIPNYTGSARKISHAHHYSPDQSSAVSYTSFNANTSNVTAAISSITISESSGSGFISNSSFQLYGIKNS